MARIRSVKPEFFSSLDIANLTERARLAFIGLWTYVDDDGRGPDEARLIKAALFPLDDNVTAKAVEKVMTELQVKGRIVRYKSPDGIALFQVNNWLKHQRIDKARPSKYPGPFDEPSTNGHGGGHE